MPIPLTAHFHIPTKLTSHFMCGQIFHMVSTDVPAGVSALPPNTQLLYGRSSLTFDRHHIMLLLYGKCPGHTLLLLVHVHVGSCEPAHFHLHD